MKKAAIAVVLALASVGARADDVSDYLTLNGRILYHVGIGITSGQKVGDGIFYSKGFSHDTPNGSYGARVGISLDMIDAPVPSFVPGVRINADYYNFGKVKWSSMNPQDEADFDGTGQQGGYNVKTGACVDGNCGVFRKFDSTGGMQAVAITIEPYWNVGGAWQLGFEVGPALYRSTWTAVATAMSDGRFGPAGTQETLTHPPKLQLGGIVGVSVARGSFAVRANYLYAPIGAWQGKDIPSGIKGEFMLSLNYTF